MIKGKIIKGIGGFYYVKTGDAVYECKGRGKFKNNNIKLLVGDDVCIEVLDEIKKVGSIDHLFSRKNKLIRPSVANVDQIIIVAAISKPKVDFLTLDKLIIFNTQNNIDTILVFNKIDEVDYKKVEEIKKIYYNVKIVFTSCITEQGIDELRSLLQGKFSVFSGNSGVGKSTLTNLITKHSIMEIGDISEKIGRGKHTTKHTEIFELDKDTFLADTPGYGNFSICNIDKDDLKLYYNEFNEYEGCCRFNMCSHTHEPGCKIKEMVSKGHISEVRYKNYISIYEELKGK